MKEIPQDIAILSEVLVACVPTVVQPVKEATVTFLMELAVVQSLLVQFVEILISRNPTDAVLQLGGTVQDFLGQCLQKLKKEQGEDGQNVIFS